MEHNRIKELREDRDIKQREIAAYLKVAQNTYSNYENGVREFPLEILILLSRFYQVNLEYLLGLTDIPTPYHHRNDQNKTPEALEMLRVLHFCP